MAPCHHTAHSRHSAPASLPHAAPVVSPRASPKVRFELSNLQTKLAIKDETVQNLKSDLDQVLWTSSRPVDMLTERWCQVLQSGSPGGGQRVRALQREVRARCSCSETNRAHLWSVCAGCDLKRFKVT